MAKLRVYQTLENNILSIKFDIEASSLTLTDQQLIEKFGEPDMDFGGDIHVPDSPEVVLFTLTNDYEKLVSGLPKVVKVDIAAAPWSTSVATYVTAYRTEITGRFVTAFTDLRENTDSLTKEFLTDI